MLLVFFKLVRNSLAIEAKVLVLLEGLNEVAIMVVTNLLA